jgi:hypothetical protein
VNRSDSIAQLAAALAAAQGAMTGAAKGAVNPHLRNKYADLASVWDACRASLSANGLCVLQTTRIEGKDGILLETTLAHASGEWVSSDLYMPVTKNDPQGFGSAITYARRYALAALVGVAPEDDDGNEASRPRPAAPAPRASAAPRSAPQAAPAPQAAAPAERPSQAQVNAALDAQAAEAQRRAATVAESAAGLQADPEDVADILLELSTRMIDGINTAQARESVKVYADEAKQRLPEPFLRPVLERARARYKELRAT